MIHYGSAEEKQLQTLDMRGGKPYSVCAGSGRSAQLKNPHMETETEKRTKTFYN